MAEKKYICTVLSLSTSKRPRSTLLNWEAQNPGGLTEEWILRSTAYRFLSFSYSKGKIPPISCHEGTERVWLYPVWTSTPLPGRLTPGTHCTGGWWVPGTVCTKVENRQSLIPRTCSTLSSCEPLSTSPSSFTLHACFRFTCNSRGFWRGKPSLTDF